MGKSGDDAAGNESQTQFDQLEELIVTVRQKLLETESTCDQARMYRAEAEEARSQATACLNEVQQIVAQLRTSANEALAAKTQIDDHQTVVASKSDHIEQAQAHADKVRSNLDRQLTAATQQAT